MIDLSQKVIVFEQKQLVNSEKLKSKNDEIQELSTEVSHLDEKMNYIRDHMKDKDEGFYELQKMAEGYCRDIEVMKEGNRHNIAVIAEKDEMLRNIENKLRG